jgi:hypothetical protein
MLWQANRTKETAAMDNRLKQLEYVQHIEKSKLKIAFVCCCNYPHITNSKLPRCKQYIKKHNQGVFHIAKDKSTIIRQNFV